MAKIKNYQISYYSLTEQQTITYKETTLYIVLENSLSITNENTVMTLLPENVFIANPTETLTWINQNTARPTTLIQITINPIFFSNLYPSYYTTFFKTFDTMRMHEKISIITELHFKIAELCILDLSKSTDSQIKTSLLLTKIILLLTQHFSFKASMPTKIDNLQMQNILNDIDNNYQNGLTLDSLATKYFISSSTLSKSFKKITGDYFSNYIKKIAINNSLNDLMHTSKSIEEIAQCHGYSSSKLYRNHFKQVFFETPTSYRESKGKDTIGTTSKVANLTLTKEFQINQSPQTLNQLVRIINKPNDELPLTVHGKESFLEVDTSLISSESTAAQASLIIDIKCLENLDSKKIQYEISELKKHNKIKLIHIQSIYKTEPSTLKTSKETTLNSFPQFETIDQIIQYLKINDLPILLTLSLEKFITANPIQQLIAKDFLDLLITQYESHDDLKWQIIFKCDCLDFLEHYHKIYHYIKKQDKKIKIGIEIPQIHFDELSSINSQNKLTQFIQSFQENIDLLTFNTLTQPLDTMTTYEAKLSYTGKIAMRLHAILNKHNLSLPLYLTEWNTLTGSTRDTNGTFFRGALIVKEMLALRHYVSAIGFPLNIDLYELTKKRTHNQLDGLELFHYFSSKRPAFFCIQLVSRLRGPIVLENDSFILTKNKDHYQLLIWNESLFDPKFSVEQSFVNAQTKYINLTLKNLDYDFYQIKEIEINRKHGALFYNYRKFDQVNNLDPETRAYIDQITIPNFKVADINASPVLNRFITLDANGVTLIELKPIKKDLHGRSFN